MKIPSTSTLCLAGLILASSTALHASTILIDFGGTEGTFYDAGTDNYWNTVSNTTTTLADLVDTTNTNSGVSLTVTNTFNGANSDGSVSGLPLLPADLNVAAATSDFVYVQGNIPFSGSGSFTLSGLDSNTVYSFTIFGSRNSTQTRQTEYEAIGANTNYGTLTTSGTNISSSGTQNFNDNTVLTFNDVTPDASGNVVFNLGRTNGDFGYLNLMQITAVIPEPSTYALATGLVCIGGVVLHRRRKQQQ
ncbi:hypothetical protein [Cerasicoccus frondis]|uniref:hypothetical protein n=1 Tax=Cerasicoccus frondis TaxID=490090 RepID=UPI002852814D|nr:hypothetical protein [Cerasicoccus frondis]